MAAEGLAYGGDYNPEQWPEEVWHEDVAADAAAGVNFVTLGVFSWALARAAPGRYDFELARPSAWTCCTSGGIGVDLATATASPPPWLSAAPPRDPARRRATGTRCGPAAGRTGARTRRSTASTPWRSSRSWPTRYGDHPALAMWHVSNE